MREFCRECRIVWLQDGIVQRERKIKQDRAELKRLQESKD